MTSKMAPAQQSSSLLFPVSLSFSHQPTDFSFLSPLFLPSFVSKPAATRRLQVEVFWVFFGLVLCFFFGGGVGKFGNCGAICVLVHIDFIK